MRVVTIAGILAAAVAAGAAAGALLSGRGEGPAGPDAPPAAGDPLGAGAGSPALRARVEELEAALAASAAEAARLREEVGRLRGDRPAASRPPPIAGFWYHSVDGGESSLLDLREGGEVLAGESRARWRLEGWRLRMSWPNPDAPGGAWEDDCLVSEDGRSYAGRNQRGMLIRGTRKPE
jgi:hypothetical protein